MSSTSDPRRDGGRCCEAPDRFITSHPDILGGTPVIKGTRISVYAVFGRLRGGDTLQDLIDDYPKVPSEAFQAAELYAKSNPEQVFGSLKYRGAPRSVEEMDAGVLAEAKRRHAGTDSNLPVSPTQRS